MTYCIFRGSTRGRGLCHGRAVTSRIRWFHSTPHHHEGPTLLIPVCCWSGSHTAALLLGSLGTVMPLHEPLVCTKYAFMDPGLDFLALSKYECVWVITEKLIYYPWHLTSISLMHNLPWLSLTPSPGVYHIKPLAQDLPMYKPMCRPGLCPSRGVCVILRFSLPRCPPAALLLDGVMGQSQTARPCLDGPRELGSNRHHWSFSALVVIQ